MVDSTGDDIETVTISSNRPTSVASPAAAGPVRHPRGLVKLNDSAVEGWISWAVSSNSFYEADTFRVSFAVSALPSSNDANWFSTQKELFAEIFVGFPTNWDDPDPSELDSLIYGRVDEISFNPHTREITLTGRDLTAAFIDTKITTQYLNKTSSEVVEALAQAHGMTAVGSKTTQKVGTYYNQDQVHLLATRSEWDEIAYLARQEGFVAYVVGKELHFEPDPIDTANPFDITWEAPVDGTASPIANVTDLNFSRALTVAKGITVTARSASLTKKTPVVQSYPSAAKAIQAGKATPFGQTQNYFFIMAAGKTPVEVESYARKRYDEIISHEMKLSARLPGDNAVKIKNPIRVTGTETAWDQTYFARAIEREMSIDEGYEMTIEAQNTSPDLQPES